MKTKTTQSNATSGMLFGNLKSLWIYGIFILIPFFGYNQTQCSFQAGNPGNNTTEDVCFYKYNVDHFELMGCLQCQITGGAIKCGNNAISNAGFSNYDMISHAGGNCFNPAVLPVELREFKFENNQFVWTTGTEIDNDYFIIEKSYDNENWVDILTTPSEFNNSTSSTTYSASLPTFESGMVYFRLSQVDFDGTKKSFEPIAIDFNSLISDVISCYPNPSNDGFISIKNTLNVKSYTILSMDGKVLESDKIQGNTLNISRFGDGVFTVHFELKDGSSQIVKIIKKA